MHYIINKKSRTDNHSLLRLPVSTGGFRKKRMKKT